MMLLDGYQATFLTVEDHGYAIAARFTRAHLSEDENIEQMGQELLMLIDHYQITNLVLSLESVEMMTSTAIGKLITLHRRLHRKDGRLILCHARGNVAEVLHTSRLDSYFTMATDTAGGLALLACA